MCFGGGLTGLAKGGPLGLAQKATKIGLRGIQKSAKIGKRVAKATSPRPVRSLLK